MMSKPAIFASPALCLGILSVLAVDNARHVRPRDAAPYHARARKSIDAFPYVIGYWTGSDVVVPRAAVKLLRPNALVSRHYTNHSPDPHAPAWADLLISQCADSRDMTGHYPPICYPSSGEPQLSARPFRLSVGDERIDGIEYQFAATPDRGIERESVYNFFVVPGRGIVPDIAGVRDAAGNYQRRCFGAAQFQVVMDADQPPEARDEVFTTLIGADPEVIKTLKASN